MLTALVGAFKSDAEDILALLATKDSSSQASHFVSTLFGALYKTNCAAACFVPQRGSAPLTQLSFQFCLIPFLNLITSRKITASIFYTNFTIVFNIAHKYINALLPNILECLDCLFISGSVGYILFSNFDR
jgi:hypothetical protein